MQRGHGVIRRADAIELVPVHVVDDAVRAGAVVVAHPGVYRLPDHDDTTTLRRAALAYCPGGALSHLDALDVWGLPTARGARIHVTVGAGNNAALSRGVQLHRRLRFAPESPYCVVRAGMRVVRIEQAVAESWRLMSLLDRRGP
jgi:hypothetical protein